MKRLQSPIFCATDPDKNETAELQHSGLHREPAL